ncbi:MAG: hypothetical protein WAW02_12905 [Sideroxyarcus sp.]
MSIYSVFYTDKPLLTGATPDLAYVIPLNFVTRDEALNKAFKLINNGTIVWKIEGPNGFFLNRERVEIEYRIAKGI